MSTFLELVQEAWRESGASGSEPSAVTSQTGEADRFVNWVALEYKKLQLKSPNWRWLRKSFTVATVASDDTYAYSDCTDTSTSLAISRFSRWYPHEFKIYLTSAGVGTQHWLPYSEWDDFRRVFRIGTQNDGYPSQVTEDPDRNIVLGAPPDAVYTLTGDYQRSPQILAADDDTPEMPAQFHDLIWLGALRRYAAFESAPEVWAESKAQHSELMTALYGSQLPPSNFAGPLA